MESLEAMRLFLVVIKAGNLSAAARQTGQSPASVSR
ncbi:MAG: LysR family transcriptional regulator [Novosphingobium sp.]